MDVVKEKLDKWGNGWRLIVGIISPVILITGWTFTQVYTLKIETINAVHGLEKSITKHISEVRNELLETNLTYHARVDGIVEKLNDVKKKVDRHQDPTNGIHHFNN